LNLIEDRAEARPWAWPNRHLCPDTTARPRFAHGKRVWNAVSFSSARITKHLQPSLPLCSLS